MQNGVIRVRVSDLLFALQKRWMIIVALSLVGMTFGLILSAMTVVQSSYQSFNITGSFAVTSKNIDGQYVGGYTAPNVNDFHLAEDMVDAVRYVLRSERVLNAVINDNELLGYSVPQIKNAITVSQYNSTQILEMKISWRNAEEGVDIWNGVLLHSNEILPETLQLGSLEIINEPQAELIGVVGSGNNKVVLLTLLGFAAGIGFAVVELLMHPTLNNVRDVETLFGVETLGVIPHDKEFYKRKGSIMTREDVGNSLVVQSFSAAAYILRNRLGTREEHHCFYVTSANIGEGKTTVAANLALQLSDMEHRTLLIDFDTRNPNLGSLFLNKVDYEHSLNALYRGDVTADEAITTLSGYLDILPAVLEHSAISVDNMLIELVDNLKERYEYVILDAPPVGVISGTLSLNQVANAVLFVIGYDNASLPEIQASLEKLNKSGTLVLGCVVNNVVSGRALGMTQTADDRKKIISKKAAAKKKEEEQFGFAEDKAESAVPSKQQDRKAAKNEKKDRKRFGRKKRSSDPPEAQEAPAQSGDPEAPLKKRNVYEDSFVQEEKAAEPRGSQETLDELVRISLSNDWGHDDAKKESKSEEPAAQADAADGDKPELATAPPAPEDTEVAEAPYQPSSAVDETLPSSVSETTEATALDADDATVSGWHTLAYAESEPRIQIIEDAVFTSSKPEPLRAEPEPKETPLPVETVKPAREPVIQADAPVQAEAPPVPSEGSDKAGAKRSPRAMRPLYILLAIPVTVCVVAALAAGAVVMVAAAAVSLAFSVNGFISVFSNAAALSEKLMGGGLSLIALMLGLFLVWLFIRTLLGLIPAFVRSVGKFIREKSGEEAVV